jgi:hypothetical protein
MLKKLIQLIVGKWDLPDKPITDSDSAVAAILAGLLAMWELVIVPSQHAGSVDIARAAPALLGILAAVRYLIGMRRAVGSAAPK